MRIVIAVATANGALRSFLAKQRPNVVPQGTVQKGYFAERQARFFVQLQAIDEKVSADSLGAWLRRIANPADALILLIDKDSRHLVQSYEDAYFIAEIPEYPGSVMQNQVSATLAPIIRHFGNFCRLFDSQKNQKVFLLPLDIFKAVDLKRLRDRLTIFKMEVGLAEDVEAIISQINERASLSYSRRSVSGPLWAFAAAGCIARTTGIAGVCFTAFGLMGFSG